MCIDAKTLNPFRPIKVFTFNLSIEKRIVDSNTPTTAANPITIHHLLNFFPLTLNLTWINSLLHRLPFRSKADKGRMKWKKKNFKKFIFSHHFFLLVCWNLEGVKWKNEESKSKIQRETSSIILRLRFRFCSTSATEGKRIKTEWIVSEMCKRWRRRAVCYIYIRKNERIKCNWVLVLVLWVLVSAIRMASGYGSVNGCILGDWTQSRTEENKKVFDRHKKQWKQHFHCKRHCVECVYLKWKRVKRALYNWLPLPLKNYFWFTFSKVYFFPLFISLAIDTQTHFDVKKKLLLFSAFTSSLFHLFILRSQKWFTTIRTYIYKMCRISLFISCTFNLKLKAQTPNWCEKISDRRREKKNKMKHLILFYLKDGITSLENGWCEMKRAEKKVSHPKIAFVTMCQAYFFITRGKN